MTWSEIKNAVEDAGIADEDEVSVIQCQTHDGWQDPSQDETWEVRKARRELFGARARRSEWMHLLTSTEKNENHSD